MADYVKKEDKALDAIASEICKLDNTLDKLDETGNRFKAWFEQKKAVHEIKKILHEADKYDKYDEKAWEQFLDQVGEDK